jgi:hypothetical protein
VLCPGNGGDGQNCHPLYVAGGFMHWICGNYLLGADGPEAPLHAFPEGIIEL